ncbi:MAG: hypothetical protein LUG93_15610 [Lachnospiraceae bacterium]|nr:hypothetical protein [Lachnospiraceae bacterium]
MKKIKNAEAADRYRLLFVTELRAFAAHACGSQWGKGFSNQFRINVKSFLNLIRFFFGVGGKKNLEHENRAESRTVKSFRECSGKKTEAI